MRNFLRLAEKIDYSSLLQQVFCQPELWNSVKVRYTDDGPLSVHKPIDDIVLRYNPYTKGEDYLDKICSSVAVVDYPAWHKLPAAHEFIFALMTRVKGKHLGRCMISRTAPGQCIPSHSDIIPPAAAAFPDRPQPAVYYERYHMVLQSGPGANFRCGDETVYMAPGEAWWFNNQIEHEVTNNSAVDRIHLVCDIRTKSDDYCPE
jgi:hypothetical protein